MTPSRDVEMVILLLHYLNRQRVWKSTLDMSLIATYICRHAHMHVGGDKNSHTAYQNIISVIGCYYRSYVFLA